MFTSYPYWMSLVPGFALLLVILGGNFLYSKLHHKK